jgi:hypothetical protein
MMEVKDRQIDALAGLVQLEKRVRAATTAEELGFLMVNDTHMLVGYRQAFLWRCDSNRIQAISGLAMPDSDAPFCIWLASLFRGRLKRPEGQTPHVLTALDLPEAEQIYWADYLPQAALWLPLGRPGKPVSAVLMLVRDDPWTEPERNLLGYLVDAYSHAWGALTKTRATFKFTGKRRLAAIAAAAFVAILLLPVRQSVLAPAEITAREPVVVRSPMQGIIESVAVRPNQDVKAGEVLLQLDPREVQSRLEVSRRTLTVAEAELRRSQEMAVFDDRGKANLAVLQGRREEQAAEVNYLESVLQRLRLTAPRDGVAIFDDASELTGKPVALGERIMMVADPKDADLEIHLPVGDAIALNEGAPVSLFLNVDAASPLSATLERAGYRASMMPEGIMAYRLKAKFAEGDPRIRVGLKGTAKVYGNRTILALYLLRRPLAALRIAIGI